MADKPLEDRRERRKQEKDRIAKSLSGTFSVGDITSITVVDGLITKIKTKGSE